MSRLILIRHSLPQISEELPARKWVLGSEGRLRASNMAIAVAAMRPASLHSSTEVKALQTAEHIAALTGLEPGSDSRFDEQDRTNEIFLERDAFRASIAAALNNPTELRFGAETISDATSRLERGVSEAADNLPPEGDLVIVSHGTILSAYIAAKVGIDPVEFWRSLSLPGIVVLNWPEPDRIVLRQNFD